MFGRGFRDRWTCTTCDGCGSPVPSCYAVCFVCLHDRDAKRIKQFEDVLEKMKTLPRYASMGRALVRDNQGWALLYDEMMEILMTTNRG